MTFVLVDGELREADLALEVPPSLDWPPPGWKRAFQGPQGEDSVVRVYFNAKTRKWLVDVGMDGTEWLILVRTPTDLCRAMGLVQGLVVMAVADLQAALLVQVNALAEGSDNRGR